MSNPEWTTLIAVSSPKNLKGLYLLSFESSNRLEKIYGLLLNIHPTLD